MQYKKLSYVCLYSKKRSSRLTDSLHTNASTYLCMKSYCLAHFWNFFVTASLLVTMNKSTVISTEISASPDSVQWQSIDWKSVESHVFKLQMRIAKAKAL